MHGKIASKWASDVIPSNNPKEICLKSSIVIVAYEDATNTINNNANTFI